MGFYLSLAQGTQTRTTIVYVSNFTVSLPFFFCTLTMFVLNVYPLSISSPLFFHAKSSFKLRKCRSPPFWRTKHLIQAYVCTIQRFIARSNTYPPSFISFTAKLCNTFLPWTVSWKAYRETSFAKLNILFLIFCALFPSISCSLYLIFSTAPAILCLYPLLASIHTYFPSFNFFRNGLAFHLFFRPSSPSFYPSASAPRFI